MKRFITNLFKLEKKPVKGLMAYEWVVMAYLVLTLIVIFFMYTTINNPQAMIFGRLRIVALTAAMWVVYRLAPCRATRFLRVGVQLGLLAGILTPLKSIDTCPTSTISLRNGSKTSLVVSQHCSSQRLCRVLSLASCSTWAMQPTIQ